jgi:hypothetical protein
MASAIPPILIELQLETSKIRASLANVEKQISGLGSTVEKQGATFTRLKTLMAGVFGGSLLTQGFNTLTTTMKGAIQDAQQYEKVLKDTQAVIATTGNVAGISVDGVKELASALEAYGVADENAIIKSQNLIATFTNVRNVVGEGNDIFNQATKAALDMSARFGGDVTSSAVRLGKALNDPIKGVMALSKMGVQFTQAQKDQIKAMVQAGDVMGAQKLVLAELTIQTGGAAKAAGDTFAGAVTRAKDKVQDWARDLITSLQPALLKLGKAIGDVINKYIKPLISFIGKNKEAIIGFVATILIAVTAWKTYTTAVKVATAIQGLFNKVAAMNPTTLIIIAVVAAIALLVAGFIKAWNTFEGFRKTVIKGLQLVINAIGYVIGGIGTMLNLITKIPGIGEKFKGIAKAVNESANDVRKFGDNLDKLANKKISMPSLPKVKDITGGVMGGALAPDGKGMVGSKKNAEDAKKQLEKNLETLKGYYEDIKDIEAKALDTTTEYNREVAKRQTKYAEDYAKLVKDRDKKIVEATKRAQEAEISARKGYAETKLKIEQDNQKAILQANKEAADKRQSIIQTSIDRLRDVFRSASALDIGKAFSDLLGGDKPEDATVGNVIQKLKDKLAGSKALQTGAQGLKEKGFSQTFIEQVIGQGTEVGTELAKQINEATPEAITELQALFTQVEETSNSGIDTLATSMNSGLTLATTELVKAYAQVTTDLNLTLAELATEFTTKMAEAQKQLTEDLAKIQKELTETLAEIATDFQEAFAELQKDLATDLAEMAYDFNKTMAGINADIDKTIAKITELMLLIGSSGKISGGGSSSTTYSDNSLFNSNSQADAYQRFKAKERADEATYNITNNINNTVNAQEIADMTIRNIKYGQIVTAGGY